MFESKEDLKIEEAKKLLVFLGMPKEQQNERSALTILALFNIGPIDSWSSVDRPMLGVTPIMDWIKENYKKNYAPNSRETFRRQTLHQFMEGGLVLYNPDVPDRSVNSPKACYQVTEEIYLLVNKFKTLEWSQSLLDWKIQRPTLIQKYSIERDMEKIPLKFRNVKLNLSPGDHSKLIRDIIEDFGPRFVPGAEAIYVGDTGAKEIIIDKEKLNQLGVKLNLKGKLPDVILDYDQKNWLLLIESVTSHGPVDSKRRIELENLFSKSFRDLVLVSAFPNRSIMAKHLPNISWETEVWTADNPEHMIHFNGDKFLGPYKVT